MATSTRSLTVPTREAAAEHKCPCGCAPCEGTCCHLDCIVRPRFFCGQLLTDADLSALLKWARDRFGLSRYRHGWGVVCGLDVRCDPKRPAGIVVTPGYAVNCCGEDILVCEPAALDLADACREEKDPCADLRRRLAETDSRPTTAINPAPGIAVAGRRHDAMREQFSGGHTGQQGAALEGGGEEEGWRVVDIYLRYDEKPSEPSTALGRGSCRQANECEYSRTRESYRLTWEFGVEGSDPVKARAVRWQEGYEKCLDVLKEFRAQFVNGFPAADVRRWLVRWIDAHPQHRLCLMRETICRASESFLTEERNLIRLLFEMVMGCRAAYLNCDCFGCEEDEGVPLARVWLMPDESRGRQGCSIAAIDPYPPYRRPIQPECWPAPLGAVNVGRFIWHRWEESCTALDDLGLHVTHQDFKLPATLAELETALQCDLFVKCDEERVALTYTADFLGERVVGFCKTTGTPPPPPPPPRHDLEVTKSSNVSEANDGQSVTYHFEVRNTGDSDLQVRLTDEQTKFQQDAGVLRPGESRAFDQSVVVHANNPDGFFRNDVMAEGFFNGARVVVKEFLHSLKVLPPPPPPPPPCPTLSIDCPPDAVVEGTPATVRLNVIGGDPNASITYNWTVSPAEVTIISGQGTPAVTLNTTGLAGRNVTAIVTLDGLPPGCDRAASCSFSVAAQPPPLCPTITMDCPSFVTPGETATFVVKVSGGDPAVTPIYNWKVSVGTITSGQGTPTITVDTSGPLNAKAITAIVEVGGFDLSCETTGSCTALFGAPGPNCPTITVTCPATIAVGSVITYTAHIVGGDPNVQPTFNWTVSAGTIQSGQGTDSITVDTQGFNELPSATATVEVSGFDPRCNATASCTTILEPPGNARKFDEFFDLDPQNLSEFPNEKARLTAFAIELQNDPRARGYIIGQGSSLNLIEQRTTRAKDYLVNTRGIDAARIVAQSSFDRARKLQSPVKVELWIVPSGGVEPGTTPVPSLTVSTETEQSIANPGDNIRSDFQINNNTNLDMVVDAEDDLQGNLLARASIAPMQFILLSRRLDVPKDGRFDLTNTIKAMGFMPDGTVVAATDTNKLEITRPRRNVVMPPPGATTDTAVRDDLTEIDQIGPARAAKLDEAGIKTFADLASATVERLKGLIPGLGEDTLKKWIEDAKSRAK